MSTIKLTKSQKTILQRAINEKAFELMQQIASELLVVWASGPVVKETQFLTAAEAIGRDERKKALRIFLEELNRLAFQDE